MQRPLFLFASGAGAPSSHPWMRYWAERLKTLGIVQTFDYEYMREKLRRPDPLAKLIAAHRVALSAARVLHRGPIILIGKSMGSRIGCHVSLEAKVNGIVCLGYPLCGGGDPTKLRDKVLLVITAPILFVQGTRDALCPLDLLESIRKKMLAVSDLHVVAAGDHSLAVTKRQLKATGETQADVDTRILRAIQVFVSSCPVQTSFALAGDYRTRENSKQLRKPV